MEVPIITSVSIISKIPYLSRTKIFDVERDTFFSATKATPASTIASAKGIGLSGLEDWGPMQTLIPEEYGGPDNVYPEIWDLLETRMLDGLYSKYWQVMTLDQNDTISRLLNLGRARNLLKPKDEELLAAMKDVVKVENSDIFQAFVDVEPARTVVADGPVSWNMVQSLRPGKCNSSLEDHWRVRMLNLVEVYFASCLSAAGQAKP